MGYTNSPLVAYTNLTSHYSKRENPIELITIHCFVGQVTAKQGCDYFATTDRQASSNYVVGKDGSIGLSVEEKNRAWTSGGTDAQGKTIYVNGISGKMNDHRAVTIEVACDTTYPYAITDAAYKALVSLCADICKRNNIESLKWQANKNLVGNWSMQNITCHRWYAATACPGDYIYNRLGQIANEVNAILHPIKQDDQQKEEEIIMYNNLSDVPEFAKGVVKKLIDAKILRGTGTGAKDEDGRPADLALTYQEVRLLELIDRAHAAGIW